MSRDRLSVRCMRLGEAIALIQQHNEQSSPLPEQKGPRKKLREFSPAMRAEIVAIYNKGKTTKKSLSQQYNTDESVMRQILFEGGCKTIRWQETTQRKLLDPTLRQKVIADYQSGVALVDLSALHHISVAGLKQLLKEAGIKLRSGREKITEAKKAEMIELVLSGQKTIEEASKLYKLTPGYIYTLVQRAKREKE